MLGDYVSAGEALIFVQEPLCSLLHVNRYGILSKREHGGHIAEITVTDEDAQE